jgi:hypothetical protein
MCTLITTPPTTYRGIWDAYSQEALRMELMESGFDKIARVRKIVMNILLQKVEPFRLFITILFSRPIEPSVLPTPNAI